MSFFSALLKKLKKQPEAEPIDRAAVDRFADKANELRHNARTGDPKLKSHHSGKI